VKELYGFLAEIDFLFPRVFLVKVPVLLIDRKLHHDPWPVMNQRAALWVIGIF
jgi:hypothetical protein